MSTEAVEGFLEQKCIREAEALSPSKELYQAFERFCGSIWAVRLSPRAFGRMLSKAGFAAQRGSLGQRLRTGLRLREPADSAGAPVAVVVDGGRLAVFQNEFGVLGAPLYC